MQRLLDLIKNNININWEPSIHTYKSKSYKKKSIKIFLLFLNFFNSVLLFNNILMMLNLNLFSFIESHYKNIKKYKTTNFYFITTNINTLKYKHKKKTKFQKLKKYRNIFVKPYINYISKMLKKSCKMIIKFNFFKLLKNWFFNININKKKLSFINFNNIYIYSKEIYNCIIYFLKNKSAFYFLKLNNLGKFIKYRFAKLKYQKLNIIKFLNYLIFKIKIKKNFKNFINLKMLIKIIKYISANIFNKNNKKLLHSLFFDSINKEYINTIDHIKNRYIKKISYLFNIYTDYNIIFKTYWNFSFTLKKKKKKKKLLKKTKNNFIYVFNNLINKYMFFIFIYWVNLFFKECIHQNTEELSNNSYFYNQKLYIGRKVSLYYEKSKFRSRFKKLPKWCYLSYFKPSKFVLYLKF